jgi:hypothetical protein
VNIATMSSSGMDLVNSVSIATYERGLSTRFKSKGEDLFSKPLSAVNVFLVDLADSEIFALLLLQTRIQATRVAMAAPTTMHPIARPIVWPLESPR